MNFRSFWAKILCNVIVRSLLNTLLMPLINERWEIRADFSTNSLQPSMVRFKIYWASISGKENSLKEFKEHLEAYQTSESEKAIITEKKKNENRPERVSQGRNASTNSSYQQQIRHTFLRFLLLAHNDACQLHTLLIQNIRNFLPSKVFLNDELVYKIDELVFLRLSIPILALARQLAKNVLSLRGNLQNQILKLYPRHSLKVGIIGL